MSLASLAAYASSDESDSEQEDSSLVNNNKQSTSVAGYSASSSSTGPSAKVTSGLDLIEDEDDHLMPPAAIASSLPQSVDREDGMTGSLFQANDIVDDVPLASKFQVGKLQKKSQKVKISVPSLSQVCAILCILNK